MSQLSQVLCILFLLTLSMVSLFSVEILEDKSSILVYSAGIIEALVKDVKSNLGEKFNNRKISLTAKKEKDLCIADLPQLVEKDINKCEPTLVVISAGLSDLIDLKNEILKENVQVAALIEQLEQAMYTIKSANIILLWP